MNPVFYVGAFVGMLILPILSLLASIFEHFATANKRRLVDAEARFDRAARDRDDAERKRDAAVCLAAAAQKELAALKEYRNSTQPSIEDLNAAARTENCC